MIRLLLWLIFGISFKHCCDDEIISTHTFDSPWKQVKKTTGFSVSNIGPWWFSSQVITVVRCTKCGRVRHIKSVVNEAEGASTTFTDEVNEEKKNSSEDSPADSGK